MAFIIASDDSKFFVDDDIAEQFGNLTWTHSDGYAKRTVGGKTVYLHKAIMCAEVGETVDHQDGDTYNCCRSNLRKTTTLGNMRNRGSHGGSSQYRCVHLTRLGWRAQPSLNGKRVHLGYFARELDAAAAVDVFYEDQYPDDYRRPNLPRLNDLLRAFGVQ